MKLFSFAQLGILFLIVFLSFAESAEGGQPAWLKFQPKEDSQYRYYIGRSNPARNQAEAFKQAYQDAVETAIKENFGYSLVINKSSYQAIDKTNFSEKVDEQFRQVEVHGFELQDQFYTEGKDSIEAFTLFRYSKQEIGKERERLELTKESAPVRSFSELRGRGTGAGGTLSIVTRPSSASIYLDGESYGKSDAKIRNLSVGQHILKIEHENYEPVEEMVNLTPGGELRVVENLQLSKGQIKIDASLPNALITVNGKVIGTSPTEFITVNAGEVIVIRAEHPEAELLLQKIEVSRNEKREVSLQLQPKPSFISLKTDPGESVIDVNGREVGKTDRYGHGKFPVPAGTLEILVKKDAFQEEALNAEIHGGETKQFGQVKLTSLADFLAKKELEDKLVQQRLDERNREAEAREKRERDELAAERGKKPWRVLFGLGGGGNSFSNINKDQSYVCCILLDLGVERRFWNTFSFRAFYSNRSGTDGTAPNNGPAGTPNSTRNVVVGSSTNEVGLGGYYILGQNFILGPEIGSAHSRLNFEKTNFDRNGISTTKTKREDDVTQAFYGINFGYESNIPQSWGGYIDTGLRQYDDVGTYRGGTVFYIKGGFMLGF